MAVWVTRDDSCVRLRTTPLIRCRHVDFLKEESVAGKPNELQFSFLFMKLLAKGPVAFIMAVAAATLMLAIAWRLVS
jgi:hypothetical protein